MYIVYKQKELPIALDCTDAPIILLNRNHSITKKLTFPLQTVNNWDILSTISMLEFLATSMY